MMSKIDFTQKSYAILLKTALNKGYHFLTFDELAKAAPSCLMRHDIDSELWSVLEMAEIEHNLGIRSTWFVMMRSTAYNLLCLESFAVIKKLLQWGHQIGLHYMGEFSQNKTLNELCDDVKREAIFLSEEFNTQIHAVSFHQPDERILNNNLVIDKLVNTYNKDQLKDYIYIADTNMGLKSKTPADIFTTPSHPRIQLLIHPMWWTKNESDVVSKWQRVINENSATLIRHWKTRERTLTHTNLVP